MTDQNTKIVRWAVAYFGGYILIRSALRLLTGGWFELPISATLVLFVMLSVGGVVFAKRV